MAKRQYKREQMDVSVEELLKTGSFDMYLVYKMAQLGLGETETGSSMGVRAGQIDVLSNGTHGVSPEMLDNLLDFFNHVQSESGLPPLSQAEKEYAIALNAKLPPLETEPDPKLLATHERRLERHQRFKEEDEAAAKDRAKKAAKTAKPRVTEEDFVTKVTKEDYAANYARNTAGFDEDPYVKAGLTEKPGELHIRHGMTDPLPTMALPGLTQSGEVKQHRDMILEVDHEMAANKPEAGRGKGGAAMMEEPMFQVTDATRERLKACRATAVGIAAE